MMSFTPMTSLYPNGYAHPSDGLPPVSPPYPTLRAGGYGMFPEGSPPAAPDYTPLGARRGLPQVKIPDIGKNKRQLELEDEVYPLKLIRELGRVSNELSPKTNKKSVFGVVHVNSSTGSLTTVESVSTYSTFQAANDRVLDFWDQKYGTRMFTDARLSPKVDARGIKKPEKNEENRRQHDSINFRKKTNGRSRGGVFANKSSWAIKNKCLSLSHRRSTGETRVYVTISHVRDQGIHV
ncbi:hypothetical protein NPX13_g2607 [Xylaria arbuscula]|uniref:Uncharacterized protein n=1 Tax=Xylaria arbuscula TaxID=114810 RepID=A0A9W8TQA4_9PEZI|nr:hypothetical protein NPX13_g2607 [Xylaria arbuscula]